ncbi:2-phospho-L-lactate guanylyltransferase [Pseudomonas sp. B392_1p]|uniref:2-phospho-L-lactate guanylyltransferase n=1 Tax=Pseudomonas sp. B392_1p TaxID=3457507 RepID=UPI003FD0DD1E
MPSHADFIWAVVPVKNFSAAKSRLGTCLGSSQRARLAWAMAADVITALKASNAADRLYMLSDSSDTCGLAAALDITWLDEASVTALPGLNAGIAGVARLAARDGATALLVIHADMPLLTADDIRLVVSTWQALDGDQRVVMVRSNDGGTNLLLAEHPQAFTYHYGPDSHARHSRECIRRHCANTTIKLSSTALDVDSVDDFHSLARAARDGRCGAHTTALLREILPATLLCDASTYQEIAS